MRLVNRTAGTALLLLLTLTAAQPAWAAVPVRPPLLVPRLSGQGVPLTLTGRLVYVDLEGGYYAVDGWMLRGDSALFHSYLDQEVEVKGTRFTGVSFQMVRAINVTSIRPLTPGGDGPQPGAEGHPVRANRVRPAAITVGGQPLAPEQEPVVMDGVLMVPLRAVVEAAGGRVGWDEATQSIAVRLAGREARFGIGRATATVRDLEEGGTREGTGTSEGTGSPERSISLARAPELVEGRTLISAEALSTVLGLMERDPQAEVLDLFMPAAGESPPAAGSPATPAPGVPVVPPLPGGPATPAPAE